MQKRRTMRNSYALLKLRNDYKYAYDPYSEAMRHSYALSKLRNDYKDAADPYSKFMVDFPQDICNSYALSKLQNDYKDADDLDSKFNSNNVGSVAGPNPPDVLSSGVELSRLATTPYGSMS